MKFEMKNERITKADFEEKIINVVEKKLTDVVVGGCGGS